MSREIFIDTADVSQIEKWGKRLSLAGVTTNQLILVKEGNKLATLQEVALSICQVSKGPVSIELTTRLENDEAIETMITEAREYHQLHPNVVIKVPMTVDGRGLEVAKRLSGEGITVNATAMMTFEQMILAINTGARYVSLFYGRSREYFEKYKGLKDEAAKEEALRAIEATSRFIEQSGAKCQIIVGSIREPEDVGDVFAAGAHIVTITPKVLEQMVYNERTKETLEQFDQAWREFLSSKAKEK